MKSIVSKSIVVLLFCLPFFSLAQKFQGQAYYQTKSKVEMKMGGDIDDAQMKKINEMLKKQFEKTFILTFNKEASVYKEEVELDKPTSQGNIKMIFVGGASSDDTFYKNTKEKRYVKDQNLFGKEFLISDTLENFDWKLEKESKMIGNYMCFKATVTREIEAIKHSTVKSDLKDIAKNLEKEKRTQVITAWYTTDIPVSHGPDKYWGLPGLIMELNVDKTQYVCTKIVMNPKDKVEIEAPTKGKKVTNEKFNEIMKKKLEEMDVNQGRKSKDSKGFSFSIGG